MNNRISHVVRSVLHLGRTTNNPPSPRLRRAGERRTTKWGFTLIELILSIALISVVVGLVGPMLLNGIGSYALVSARKAALAQARLVMDRFFSEARLIPDTASIDTWTASAIQFDIPSESNISYSLSGTNLMRSGAVLADGVTSLAFTYRNSSGGIASAKADIWRIGIEIVIDAGADYGMLKVRTQVFPRRFASRYVGFQ